MNDLINELLDDIQGYEINLDFDENTIDFDDNSVDNTYNINQ